MFWHRLQVYCTLIAFLVSSLTGMVHVGCHSLSTSYSPLVTKTASEGLCSNKHTEQHVGCGNNHTEEDCSHASQYSQHSSHIDATKREHDATHESSENAKSPLGTSDECGHSHHPSEHDSDQCHLCRAFLLARYGIAFSVDSCFAIDQRTVSASHPIRDDLVVVAEVDRSFSPRGPPRFFL